MAPLPVLPPPTLQFVSPTAHKKPPKIFIHTINPEITCNLCKGYLIDATTIVECLHSFCHSCLMKHLKKENYCPRCEMMINKAKPNIKPDATLQAIVYKLVPGLYEKELLRKRAFYRERPVDAMLATPEQRGEDTEHLIFIPNEHISLSLEYADLDEIDSEDENDGDIIQLKKIKYYKCHANFTVALLKKLVIEKFRINTKEFYVEIMYKVKTIVLPEHYTLMDVAYIYTWKRDVPMRYFYRIRTHKSKLEEVPEVPLTQSPSTEVIHHNTEEKMNEMITKVNKSDSKIEKEIETKIENLPVKVEEIDKKVDLSLPKITVNHETKKKIKKEKLEGDKSNHNNSSESLKLVIDLANQKVKESSSSNSCINSYSEINSSSDTNKTKNDKCDSKDELKLKIKLDPTTSSSPKSGTNSPKDNKSPKLKENKSPILKFSPTLNDSSDSKTNDETKFSKTLSQIIEDLEIDEKKSEFLNSFQLTPKKSLSPVKQASTVSATTTVTSLTNTKVLTSSSTSTTIITTTTTTTQLQTPQQTESQPKIKITFSKRKNKDSERVKGTSKKQKLLDGQSSVREYMYKIKTTKSCEPKVVSTAPVMTTSTITSTTSSSISKNNLLPKEQNQKKEKEMISFSLAPYPIGSNKINLPPTKGDATKINETKLLDDVAKSVDGKDSNLMKPPTLPPPSLSLSSLKLPKPKSVNLSVSPPKNLEVAKSDTTFVVNNLKRPSQSDTPRPIQPNQNKKTNGLMKPPQLPPPSTVRRTPLPILPKRPAENGITNKLMNFGGTTEIKKIENNDKNKNIKVYGPSEGKPISSPSNNGKESDKSPPPLSYSNGGLVKNSMSGGYLNYALMNSSKNKMINGGGNGGDSPHPNQIALSRMTPSSHYANMKSPKYTPNSPIYSPNSPQYTPNYNIPTQPQYKYMKQPVYASTSFLQTFLPQKKLLPKPNHNTNVNTTNGVTGMNNNTNSNSKTKNSIEKVGQKRQSPLSLFSTTNSIKNDSVSPKRESNELSPPPEKQVKVQSLLDSCNISLPASLSITLTNDKDDPPENSIFNKSSSPVNNYIEILKLSSENDDEITITRKKTPSPPSSISLSPKTKNFKNSTVKIADEQKIAKPIPNLNPVVKSSSSTPTSPTTETTTPTTATPPPPSLTTSTSNSNSNNNTALNPSTFQDCYILALNRCNKIKSNYKASSKAGKNSDRKTPPDSVSYPKNNNTKKYGRKTQTPKPAPLDLTSFYQQPGPPIQSTSLSLLSPQPSNINNNNNNNVNNNNINIHSNLVEKYNYAPQSLPAFLNETALRLAATHNNNFMTHFASLPPIEQALWLQYPNSINKALANLYSHNKSSQNHKNDSNDNPMES